MSSRLLLPLTLALTIAGSAGLASCGGPEYAVGDCVKVKQKMIDQELKGVECSDGSGSFSDPIYKVNEVLEGSGGNCPGGLGSVTFSDEPADSTYCLNIASIS